MKTKDKAKLCFRIVRERKAIDPVFFEVGKFSSMTDCFIIASGNSTRQVQAIARHIQRRMREEGFRTYGIEGEKDGHWILMDYGDIVIHLFYQPAREFYDLEGLWVDAPRIIMNDENFNEGGI
jgi:ribosome-associated protein